MSEVVVEKLDSGVRHRSYYIKEKGKSNFVTDKSLVNNIINDYNNKLIK